MKTWFISRHSGAIHWMQVHGPHIDEHITHLENHAIHAGDKVVGTLPLHLAAHVCAIGAQYWHLSFSVPEHLRGQELTTQELEQLGATLKQYSIQELT